MLFTWDTTNLCIVFRSWRVTNTFTLILFLTLVVALCAGYEAVRELSRRYEAAVVKRVEATPSMCSISYFHFYKALSWCGWGCA
jgi:copper transporter 1